MKNCVDFMMPELFIVSKRLNELMISYGLDVDGDFIVVKKTNTDEIINAYIDEMLIWNSTKTTGITTDDDGTLNIITRNGCEEFFNMIDNGSLVIIGRMI